MNAFSSARKENRHARRSLLPQLPRHQHRHHRLGGRTLHRSGRIFLLDAFHGNAPLADSVNQLLVVGFYLINVGYIALALKTEDPLKDFRGVIELESAKIGVVLLILGAMHFFNMFVLARMRRRTTREATA